MDASFAEAKQKLAQHGLPTDGTMLTVYHNCNLKTQMFDYTSGFALPDSANSVPTELSRWSIPQTRALSVEHIGIYKHLGNAWSAANQFARYKKLKQSRVGTFEIYKNDPNETETANLRTVIYLPLK
jgi:effector-binding domain-containing protein